MAVVHSTYLPPLAAVFFRKVDTRVELVRLPHSDLMILMEFSLWVRSDFSHITRIRSRNIPTVALPLDQKP